MTTEIWIIYFTFQLSVTSMDVCTDKTTQECLINRKIKGWDTLTPAGQGYGGNLSPLPYISTNGAHIWKKNNVFFLKLYHFLSTFCKKCIFTIENPKKYKKISKNDKTTFRQANFCILRCQILLWHPQWRPQHTKFWQF